MNNKYIKSLGGEEHIEMLGTEGRITAGEESRRDEWQQTIRPQRLSDYIGQSTFKENLHVYISAARSNHPTTQADGTRASPRSAALRSRRSTQWNVSTPARLSRDLY